MGSASDRPGSASVRTGPARRATLRDRAAATAVDVVVVLAVCLFVPQPFPPVVPLLLMVAYQALTTWWLRASLGKALLGLRVIRLDGDVTLWWSLLRAGPGQLGLTIFGLGWVMAALAPDRRPLHDRVLRGDVLVVEPTSVPAHRAAARLADWARRRQDVAQRKQNRTWGGLTLLWAWLAGLGGAVQRAVDWLHGGGASGQSAAVTMSTSAAAAVGGAAAAAVAVVLAPFPPLGGAAEWLVSPRQWVGTPESSDLGAGAAAGPDITGVWLGGSSRDPYEITNDGEGFSISRTVSLEDVDECGQWTQALRPVPGQEAESPAFRFDGGDVMADVERCYEILDELIGPTDTSLVHPVDRLIYDSERDRIAFWFPASHPDDPERVTDVGPHYLYRAP